jgi:hypothetical protein
LTYPRPEKTKYPRISKTYVISTDIRKRKQEFERVIEFDGIELNDTSDAWVATNAVQYKEQYYVPAVAMC